MELQNDIQPTSNDTQGTTEDIKMRFIISSEKLAEFLCLEEIKSQEIHWGDVVYKLVSDTEAEQLKATLREMRVRILKPFGIIKRLRNLLFSQISLLFGLCSSQSSLILNAFYGNSLSRIPSL
jgi:hypothetical protein